MYNFYVHL